MKKFLIYVFTILFILCGCSNKEISEKDIYHKLNWEGKEIIFYETSELSYTDDEKVYTINNQKLNSSNNTKRLYITFDLNNQSSYTVYQNGEKMEPIDSFNYKNFDSERYSETLTLLKKINLIDDEFVLSNVDVSIYSLDLSKKTTIQSNSMSDYISKKWIYKSDTALQGIEVDFTLEELQKMIISWKKANLVKDQVKNKVLTVSWSGNKSSELIYSIGEIHMPEIGVYTVISNDIKYIEVIDRLDFYDASISYYDLTDQQWNEFNEWYENLK